MPPFELPDFYMPYPARLNPHVEGARTHSKAWARAMKMLDSGNEGQSAGLWSEHKFDAMDFAFFAAYTHPDAPPAELDLLSEWYIWGWFVDDYCPKVFEQTRNLAGAKQYVARILEFLPIDLGTPVPEPTNPVELAVADLWPRTAPAMSPAWRRRYVANIQSLATAYLHEISSGGRDNDQILDPVEFVALRREVGGIFWSAHLVEHSLELEIPAQIYHSRPIRVLNDTFADVAGLRNDIISYQIDIDEGKVNNGVVVMEHLLGCDLQQAANVVNDMVTSRLYQFENTVATELGALFDEHRLDPLARQQVLRYVKALQDWLAGDLEWELRPGGRYLPAQAKGTPAAARATGLGTTAARLGWSRSASGLRLRSYSFVPYQPVAPVAPPELSIPFTTEVHPHLDAARKRSKAWARQMGMLPGAPGTCLWDDATFDANDAALLGALGYPDASDRELDERIDFLTWGLYLDDNFVMVHGHRRDAMGARAYLTGLPRFMPLDPTTPTPVPTDPVERGLADLWSRMARSTPAHQLRTVRSEFEAIFDAFWWEHGSRLQNRIPDLVDHIEMRRKTYGAELLVTLLRTSPGAEISPELAHSRPVREMNKCACDVAGLLNEIVSYQKEIAFEGAPFNALPVVQCLLDCDLPHAIEVIHRLMTARVRRFEQIAATGLQGLSDELELDAQGREKLKCYVDRLQRWMCSQVQWHGMVQRYDEHESRKMSPLHRLLSGGPTGLGTSTTRVSAPPARHSSSEPVEPGRASSSCSMSSSVLRGPTGLGTSAARCFAHLTVPD
jgi:germacradienol/geosmin synthase